MRNGRAPTRFNDRVSVTLTPLTASRSLELKSVAAVVELSLPRAKCRSPSTCPLLSVRVHLRDPSKPAQGSPGLVFVPGALNCSSESNWTREPRRRIVGIVLGTKCWYDRSGELASLSPFPRCSFALFRLVSRRFAVSGHGVTACESSVVSVRREEQVMGNNVLETVDLRISG